LPNNISTDIAYPLVGGCANHTHDLPRAAITGDGSGFLFCTKKLENHHPRKERQEPDCHARRHIHILVPAIRKLRIAFAIRNAAERGMFRNKRPPEYPGGGLFGEVPDRTPCDLVLPACNGTLAGLVFKK
jgi:hypothetical protein